MDSLAYLRAWIVAGAKKTAVLKHLVSLVLTLQERHTEMASKLDQYVAQFNAALADNTAKIQAQTTVIGGVKTLLEGLVAQNAALKTQLEEAIANGGDPATLQPIIDALNTQDDAIQANTDALAAAVAANTPQAPQG